MQTIKKRMLIISLNQSERDSGGIEQYNRKLIQLFNNDFIVDEFDFIKTSNNKNPLVNSKHFIMDFDTWKNKSWFYRNFYYRKEMQKQLNVYLKNRSYDIFINATNICFNKIYKKNGYIFVVHFDPVFISNSNLGCTIIDRIKSMIFHLMLFLFNQKNPLINAKNIVAFFQSFIPDKYVNYNTTYHYIPIAKYSENEINEIWSKYNNNFTDKYHKKIMYLGRIENHQKNVQYLIENFNNIDYYGIIENNELKEKIRDNYKGILTNNQELQSAFFNHSFTILASKSEGFPNVFVESLSTCTPIISSHLIKANNYFNIKKNDIGFILNVNNSSNSKKLLDTIDQLTLDKYSEMCKNAYDFAINNLTIEKFNSKWKNTVAEIIKKQS